MEGTFRMTLGEVFTKLDSTPRTATLKIIFNGEEYYVDDTEKSYDGTEVYIFLGGRVKKKD